MHRQLLLPPEILQALLEAGREDGEDAIEPSDDVAREVGDRVLHAITSRSYEIQADRLADRPRRFPLARFEEGDCRWVDERLMKKVAEALSLQLPRDTRLIGHALHAAYELACQENFCGSYGSLVCAPGAGLFSLDIADGVMPCNLAQRANPGTG